MRSETVKITASFKLDGLVPDKLFQTYRQILCELLDHAYNRGISSFKRLRAGKYYDLRARYPDLPSHYIYTACQMACSIYKSFRKLKRRNKAGSEKPFFKKDVVMLDGHLFSIDLDKWVASIAAESGRRTFGLLHGTYHEKFRDMRVGQAWLVRRDDSCYLKVVFSKIVEIAEPNGRVLAVDMNENSVAYGTDEEVKYFKNRGESYKNGILLEEA